jgi:type I restriction enzyme, S subunit
MTKPGFKRTALGDIPLEWEVKKLEDVAEIISGSTPLRAEKGRYFSKAGIRWVKTTDLNESWIDETQEYITEEALNESNCKMIPPNSVLVAMYGGWNQIGRTAILRNWSTTNQAISAIIPNSRIASGFLLYYLQHARSEWRHVAVSSRKDPNITRNNICNFLVVLPPLKLQEWIFTIFSSVDDLLESSRRVLDQVRELRRGVMQNVLTRGVPGWHEEFKDSEFGRIPASWEVKTFEDVTKIITDMDHKMPQACDEGIPLISVTDFTEYGIDYASAKRISLEDYERLSRKCKLEKGDFLFARYGTIGEVRKIEISEPLIASYSIAMIKVDFSKIDPSFFFYVLGSENTLKQASKETVQSAQPDLGLKHLKKFVFGVPPLLEQEKIVSILSSFDQRIQTETQRITSLEHLKKGLMQHLLTGKLRVKLEVRS